MSQHPYYAHSLKSDTNPDHWQTLEQHLSGVAETAAMFAEAFSSRAWGYLAGLWHDVGKYQIEFQKRLIDKVTHAPHSGVGAVAVSHVYKGPGRPLSFVIAGHHAGLANKTLSGPGFPTSLEECLQNNMPILERLLHDIPHEVMNAPIPPLPAFLKPVGRVGDHGKANLNRNGEFWMRFLFSALVDADRLDTEAFTSPEQAARRGRFAPISELRKNIDDAIDEKTSSVSAEEAASPVNRMRIRILAACRAAAEQPPGFFSLTAPTGGGKTLSAMSFALRHAEKHNLRRAIVVIPYTSIIEQNAMVYREALGPENVVEHHSDLDPEKRLAALGEEVTTRHDLACENWDAPVVVTTSVQFFESLFSNRPSTCRKLHNLSQSVIILDEVQTLPPGFLLCILDGLNELVEHYGCSVVLSTATPPALAARESLKNGLKNLRPIIPDAEQQAANPARVVYVWPDVDAKARDWPELAAELAEHRQALAVVHRREDARILTRQLQNLIPGEQVFHLSALMCAAHRSDALAEIRNMLARGEPCRVLSTQLVEAGVDVDFPVVYRAMGGLDSIVQAAGRCNREGRLDSGRVVIFKAPTSPPGGTPRKALETTLSLLKQYGGTLNPDDPALFETYFRMLYNSEHLDAHGIQTLRETFNFATVAHEFKLIEDGFTRPVVVPYGEGRQRVETLRNEGAGRETLRALQPFIVNVYPRALEQLRSAGAIEEVEGVLALTQGFEAAYDATFGLVVGDDLKSDPGAFIV